MAPLVVQWKVRALGLRGVVDWQTIVVLAQMENNRWFQPAKWLMQRQELTPITFSCSAISLSDSSPMAIECMDMACYLMLYFLTGVLIFRTVSKLIFGDSS
jgi:hypothetical protein